MATLQRMPIATGSEDRDGYLIVRDGALVAVLVRLDMADHGDLRGKWYLEVAFEHLARQGQLFESPQQALLLFD